MSRSYSIFLLLIILLLPLASESQTIAGPEVKVVNNDLFVTFSVGIENKSIEAMRNGVDKDLTFYIDLFKIRKIWPDEFVLGKSYVRTIRVDPIKKEFIATSSDGSVIVEKRFKSFDSMLAWAVSFRDLKLTNVRELEPGQYFVRVTVESKVRKLPPVIGYLFIFISENEFKAVRDSAPVSIEGVR
ncbi:MAG: DUF4390 domain-containing protein [Nitrospirae bacterium]|nr:DUF4390 domain-containing protein [Nitrospirota bacterium]